MFRRLGGVHTRKDLCFRQGVDHQGVIGSTLRKLAVHKARSSQYNMRPDPPQKVKMKMNPLKVLSEDLVLALQLDQNAKDVEDLVLAFQLDQISKNMWGIVRAFQLDQSAEGFGAEHLHLKMKTQHLKVSSEDLVLAFQLDQSAKYFEDIVLAFQLDQNAKHVWGNVHAFQLDQNAKGLGEEHLQLERVQTVQTLAHRGSKCTCFYYYLCARQHT